MLTASPIRGDGSYYQRLAQTDYYTKGGEPPGKWVGRGAKQLGLIGRSIGDSELKNLLVGFSPDGRKKFVHNAGKKNRQRGFDFTFSAPKDLSVVWAASPRWMQLEIQRAQQAAVERAIRFIEDHALFTRRGHGGTDVERAAAVVATYEHATSRAEEPQLHTHALLANICLREDGSTGTFYGRVIEDKHGNPIGINPLLDFLKASGAVYRIALESEVNNRLGIETVPAKNGGFMIPGVDRRAVKEYSTRKHQIEEHKRELGFDILVNAEVANLATREEKREIDRKVLFAKWKSELSKFGLTEPEVEKFCNKAIAPDNKQSLVETAIRTAELALATEDSCFNEAKLFELAANLLTGTGVGVDELEQGVESEVTSGQIVSLGRERLQRVFASQENLRLEDQLTRNVRALGKNQTFRVSASATDKAIAECEQKNGFKFDEDYLNAIRFLTSGSVKGQQQSGASRVLIGDAGSGKTTLLGAVRDAFERDGYKVVGAALAGRAADVLETKAGIKSATIDKWNFELDRTALNKAVHHGNMLVRVAKGKQSWSLDNFSLDDKTVLVIDEAAMTSTAKLSSLVEQAQKKGAMIIWSGDEKQCQAIGHGGAFSMASQVCGVTRLGQNFRQESGEDVELSSWLSSGKAEDALRRLAANNQLDVSSTRTDAIDQLVESWSKQGVRVPKQNQIIVTRHKDRKNINRLCQEKRISAHKRRLRIGLENHDGQMMYRGDRIQFGENVILNNQHQSLSEYMVDSAKSVFSGDPGGKQRIRRGQFGSVLAINPFTKVMRVKLDDGRLLNVPTEIRDKDRKPFMHANRKLEVSLGYASTTHSVQGSEFNNTFVLTDPTHQNRELSYVQMTRHKKGLRVFTTLLEAGNELTLRAHLMKAKTEGNQEKVEELRKKAKEAAAQRGERIRDGLLARLMAKSEPKEFALDPHFDKSQSPAYGSSM